MSDEPVSPEYEELIKNLRESEFKQSVTCFFCGETHPNTICKRISAIQLSEITGKIVRYEFFDNR